MKSMILALALFTLTVSSCTKEDIARFEDNISRGGDDHGGSSGSGRGSSVSAADVPEAVIAVYNEKYAGAENAEWKKLDTGNYKVQFSLNGTKIETTFTPDGDIVKEEKE